MTSQWGRYNLCLNLHPYKKKQNFLILFLTHIPKITPRKIQHIITYPYNPIFSYMMLHRKSKMFSQWSQAVAVLSPGQPGRAGSTDLRCHPPSHWRRGWGRSHLKGMKKMGSLSNGKWRIHRENTGNIEVSYMGKMMMKKRFFFGGR